MQHLAGHVRRGAERWIPNHVHVGEAGETERVAEAAAARAFNVCQDFKIPGDLESGVERQDAGGGVFAIRVQAVGPAVLGEKRAVFLADEVGLAGDPESTPKGGTIVGVLRRPRWRRGGRNILRRKVAGRAKRDNEKENPQTFYSEGLRREVSITAE